MMSIYWSLAITRQGITLSSEVTASLLGGVGAHTQLAARFAPEVKVIREEGRGVGDMDTPKPINPIAVGVVGRVCTVQLQKRGLSKAKSKNIIGSTGVSTQRDESHA